MVQLMAKFTTKEHGAVVENTLIAEVRRLHSIYTQKNFRHDHIQDLSCQLSHMLQLVEVWVEWNGGAAVSSPLDICNVSFLHVELVLAQFSGRLTQGQSNTVAGLEIKAVMLTSWPLHCSFYKGGGGWATSRVEMCAQLHLIHNLLNDIL